MMVVREDVLLINHPTAFGSYSGTRVNASVQVFPLISYACLAAILREKNFKVSVLDLGIEDEPYRLLDRVLDEKRPRIIGMTSTTALFLEVAELSRMLRKKLGNQVKLVLGGPHPSVLPKESLAASEFDIVAVGEGDMTIVEIAGGKKLSEIKGIYYKEGQEIYATAPRPAIKDLDSLPFPALDMFDIKRYRCPRLVSRKNPMAKVMTSRGCAFNCSFCGKGIFGRSVRYKSPARVIDEIKYDLSLGYQEIHIIDDQFTTDMPRAKEICRLILKEGLKFPWNLAAGLRVNCVDEEFLRLAKRAGLYQVSIGFESGDQACLDSIDKGITLEQGIRAMELVKKVGLESVGFFMFGLPVETEESMKRTINFALKLMPDLAKVTITMPTPDSRLFQQFDRMGLIKSRDWSLYKLHGGGAVYRHPNLSHQVMNRYYDLFYFKFYFNPKWLFKRLMKGIKDKTLGVDLIYALQTFFPGLFKRQPIA
ncbi:MAG: radical SAM protein [Candidatus Omnitrophica bacterium]|nr:radical SAM protein [Candidatus Omnitrophota bacterium]